MRGEAGRAVRLPALSSCTVTLPLGAPGAHATALACCTTLAALGTAPERRSSSGAASASATCSRGTPAAGAPFQWALACEAPLQRHTLRLHGGAQCAHQLPALCGRKRVGQGCLSACMCAAIDWLMRSVPGTHLSASPVHAH